LSAAAALIREKSYREISIDGVARKAGMAKGTVFLYFQTKEELFLAIASREFEGWFDAMDRAFTSIAGGPAKGRKNRVVAALRDAVSQESPLGPLIPILHTILEQNIGYDQARDFKKMLSRRLDKTGTLLEECLAFLKSGQGVTFLLWMYAFVIGLMQMAVPAPIVKKVFHHDPELGRMQLDFGKSYEQALAAILNGWSAQNR
jgi:AcrR family transcriptional regulator